MKISVFRHYNFRLYFFGQLISVIGSWTSITAVGWLAYRLDDSPFLLGLVFALQTPFIFLLPFAGSLIDRVNRRTLLIVTQVLSLVQALALAALTTLGGINISILIALALCVGCPSSEHLAQHLGWISGA